MLNLVGLRVPRRGNEQTFSSVSSEIGFGVTGIKPTLAPIRMKAVLVLGEAYCRIKTGLVKSLMFRAWADRGGKGSRKIVYQFSLEWTQEECVLRVAREAALGGTTLCFLWHTSTSPSFSSPSLT